MRSLAGFSVDSSRLKKITEIIPVVPSVLTKGMLKSLQNVENENVQRLQEESARDQVDGGSLKATYRYDQKWCQPDEIALLLDKWRK